MRTLGLTRSALVFLVGLPLAIDAIIGRPSRIKWYLQKNSQFNSWSAGFRGWMDYQLRSSI